MRAVQTCRHLYLFNPWSDGVRAMSTATYGTPTFRRMTELAATRPGIAARHRLLRHRVAEELYDVDSDPDCLHNLAGDPAHRRELERLRGLLDDWMTATADPVLEVFRRRDDEPFRRAWIARLEKSRATAKTPRQPNKPNRRNLPETNPRKP
jgi:N-sulfoglucosamine sulfohydrolase